jgi:hypothetical protein
MTRKKISSISDRDKRFSSSTQSPVPLLGPTQPSVWRKPGVKRPEREADNSCPSTAEHKNTSSNLRDGFLFVIFFDPEDEGEMFRPKRRLTFSGLHAVTSEKTNLHNHRCWKLKSYKSEFVYVILMGKILIRKLALSDFNMAPLFVLASDRLVEFEWNRKLLSIMK